MIALRAAPSAPLELVFSCADEGDSKALAPDNEETRVAQDRRPTEVIESSYPTIVKNSYINFSRYKGTRRVERDSLLEKRRVYEEIEKGLLVQRCAVLLPVHKE